MKAAAGKSAKRTKPNYVTSILAVALVLFIIGFFSTVLLKSSHLMRSLKENVLLQLELKDNLTETDVLQFSKMLESESYVKDVEFVSKEAAAEEMQEELGENFLEILGFNPLFSSINIHLNAQYANPDSIELIKVDINETNNVKDIIYDDTIVDALHKNSRKAFIAVSIFSAILLIITIILIDSTIKLAMFSNRFLIRSMQLVGATRWFIIKPFILTALFNGFVSGVLASVALIWLIFYVENYVLDVALIGNWIDLSIISGGMILLGMLISWFSTYRAVGKYLKMKLDNLY